MDRTQAWLAARRYAPRQLAAARAILEDVRAGFDLDDAIRRHPQAGAGYIPKHILVHVYRQVTASGEWPFDQHVMRAIRMKPIRTLSGVSTVSVLTMPYPCPGECIFCPTDVRVPKSYLPDEPGAMRALQHGFDPYEQTRSRLEALEAIGHPTEKVELLILGGTWSAYPGDYQDWFVQRCLDALNEFASGTLAEAQEAQFGATHKNVGLVIETRPDHVTPEEISRLRRLGVTKVQLGAQSLDDRILEINRRGHTVEDTRRAVSLLRAAGFKIVLHWMPNLLGTTEVSDREDFDRLWSDTGLRPDEIKIYPCQLLENAELYRWWRRGQYTPYSTEDLIRLIADAKETVPKYCRVNRVVRDIPSTRVVAGCRRTSLRQDVQHELHRRGKRCACIRCREIGSAQMDSSDLLEENLTYLAGGAEEHFLSYVTPEDRLVGYLRLSLPGPDSPETHLDEICEAALVRELHIYGQSLPLGEMEEGAAQHAGLGARLMAKAESLAKERGYRRMSVIASLGTRAYYQRQGYELGETYMTKVLA